MSNEHLFISDVHLGALSADKNREVEEELIKLIEYAISKNAQLYVLGDLFDYWMEFPNSEFLPSIGRDALDAFEEYNRTISPALYITGNHDNWTLKHFSDRGFDVEENHRIITLGNSKILLMHGDGTFDSDGSFSRPALHRLLRNQTFLKSYQSILPNSVALNLMKKFSEFARKIDQYDAEALSEHAPRALKLKKADIIICGHDHIPRTEHFNEGLYINTGTFFHHKTLARYVDGELSLVTWKSTTKEFIPFS